MNFRSGGMQTDNALGPAVRREPNWHEVRRETQFRKSERFPRVAAKWSTFVRFKRFISMMMINSLNTQHSAQISNSIYYTAIDLFSSISKKTLTISLKDRLSLLHLPTVIMPAKFINQINSTLVLFSTQYSLYWLKNTFNY